MAMQETAIIADPRAITMIVAVGIVAIVAIVVAVIIVDIRRVAIAPIFVSEALMAMSNTIRGNAAVISFRRWNRAGHNQQNHWQDLGTVLHPFHGISQVLLKVQVDL